MKDWKRLVAAVAPSLATALGGPLAGVATQALGAALLGKEQATDDELATAIYSGGADALAKIKQADQDFAVRMEELGLDLERIHAGDRDSARKREAATGDSITPRVLACLIVAGWLAVEWFLLHSIVPSENREIVMRGMGTLDAAITFVLGYYFGTSASSARKDDLLHRSVPAEAPGK